MSMQLLRIPSQRKSRGKNSGIRAVMNILDEYTSSNLYRNYLEMVWMDGLAHCLHASWKGTCKGFKSCRHPVKEAFLSVGSQ
jgi:hypothetical protein